MAAHPTFAPSSTSIADNLLSLLRRRFHHAEFRAGQLEVCAHVARGGDALLVMPTGAGKSLCYQVPGLARNGTTLVVSPLIALMEDQSTKLRALDMRVACIHSSLDREHARAASRAYLDGSLNFLFVAPERFRVPGFVDMLARKPPALVAVDEAHCISQWGHDFREDYRTLGGHIARLRPAPVLALTATATPTVQRDICAQLGLASPAQFVHGFRRANLAIEIMETPKPARPERIRKLLGDPASRPAIIYTVSRREAEELATTLSNDFRCEAYHAGLPPETRSRVQRRFLAGELEAVVATVAFGMGVDKADIRTVVHAALPGTLESYYQEIGRAGRDGNPSRAILLHSYADVRAQQFFIERDYPKPDVLAQIHGVLRAHPVTVNELRRRMEHLDDEEFSAALDRLLTHGGAQTEEDSRISLGTPRWHATYNAHITLRQEQLRKVTQFVEAHGCRMAHLVMHFGDTHDASRDCGVCDWCARSSSDATSANTRKLSDAERRALRDAVAAFDQRTSYSTRTLQEATATGGMFSQQEWKALLRAAAREDILFCETETFQKNGDSVTYVKVSLGKNGGPHLLEAALNRVSVAASQDIVPTQKPAARAGKSPSAVRPPLSEEEKTEQQARRKQAWQARTAALSPQASALADALRRWRVERARELKVPAYFLLGEMVLMEVAAAAPRSLRALRGIKGIGPDKLNRFGEDIVRVCSTAVNA